MRFSEKDIRKAVSAKINSMLSDLYSIDQANWYVVRCVLEDDNTIVLDLERDDWHGKLIQTVTVKIDITIERLTNE